MPRILRLWYLESFLSPSRHSTSAVADKTEPRGCECPSRAPVAWVTKAVADARGKGRRCQAISSRNPSQEFLQHLKSTCPNQGLGHVLIHHYGNTVSPTRVLKLRTATSTQALPSSAGDNSSPVENAKTDPYASSTWACILLEVEVPVGLSILFPPWAGIMKLHKPTLGRS